jgi:hypothetical protein
MTTVLLVVRMWIHCRLISGSRLAYYHNRYVMVFEGLAATCKSMHWCLNDDSGVRRNRVSTLSHAEI